jgi:hypothetical protein
MRKRNRPANSATPMHESLSFTAPANAGALGYLILAPYSVDASEAYIGIDNISVTAVHEPSTWVLASLGLFALCGAGRRRRERVVARCG